MPGPVAVTGLGVVCSIGQDVASFTTALWAGRCGIEPVAQPAPGLLAAVRDFDLAAALDRAAVTRLAPATRRAVLRAGRRSPLPVQVSLAAATQAWQQADLGHRRVPGERVGLVVAGHNLTGWYAFDHYPTFRREPRYLPARYALHVQDTDHVGTLSRALGITGEGGTVGASSASGNLAVMHAARLLGLGAVDVCLAVGPMVWLSPPEWAAAANLGLLARPGPDPGRPAGPGPLDRGRTGFVPGEAAAALVLETGAGARRRGVSPLAELAGFAQVLDGRGLTDPDVTGETRAMRAALARAGISAVAVDYVNAHATGTPAGDDAELRAMHAVLNGARPWVNSTKALVGHCLAAAGVVEAVATVVQMRYGFVHPNPHLVDPADPAHRLAGPVPVPAEIGCALSNSFGFGGFNSSLVLRAV